MSRTTEKKHQHESIKVSKGPEIDGRPGVCETGDRSGGEDRAQCPKNQVPRARAAAGCKLDKMRKRKVRSPVQTEEKESQINKKMSV